MTFSFLYLREPGLGLLIYGNTSENLIYISVFYDVIVQNYGKRRERENFIFKFFKIPKNYIF